MRGRSTIGSASHTSRCEPHGQVRAARAVVARQADKEKTKKRRTKDEQRTNKERTKNEQRTNKERTKNEQRTVRATRADEGKTKEERC